MEVLAVLGALGVTALLEVLGVFEAVGAHRLQPDPTSSTRAPSGHAQGTLVQ